MPDGHWHVGCHLCISAGLGTDLRPYAVEGGLQTTDTALAAPGETILAFLTVSCCRHPSLKLCACCHALAAKEAQHGAILPLVLGHPPVCLPLQPDGPRRHQNIVKLGSCGGCSCLLPCPAVSSLDAHVQKLLVCLPSSCRPAVLYCSLCPSLQHLTGHRPPTAPSMACLQRHLLCPPPPVTFRRHLVLKPPPCPSWLPLRSVVLPALCYILKPLLTLFLCKNASVGTSSPDACGICAARCRRASDGLAATLDHLCVACQHPGQGLPRHTALTRCTTPPTSGAGGGGQDTVQDSLHSPSRRAVTHLQQPHLQWAARQSCGQVAYPLTTSAG